MYVILRYIVQHSIT